MTMMLMLLMMTMMMRSQESNTKSEAKDFPNLVGFCWDKRDGLGLVRKKSGSEEGQSFHISTENLSDILAFCLLFVIYREDK